MKAARTTKPTTRQQRISTLSAANKARRAREAETASAQKKFWADADTRAAGQLATRQAATAQRNLSAERAQNKANKATPEVRARADRAGIEIPKLQKAVYEFIHVQKFGGMGRAKLHPEAQKYPEAKKEAAKKQATPAAPDLSKPRGIFGRGADVSGKKTGSWFGDLMRDALEVYRGRGDHAQTQAAAVAPQTSQIQNMVRSTQPEQIQKDVKSLAGGTNWKRQKQRIPRAKTKRFHHDWDRSQYAGAGGSQVMGYATDQNQ